MARSKILEAQIWDVCVNLDELDELTAKYSGLISHEKEHLPRLCSTLQGLNMFKTWLLDACETPQPHEINSGGKSFSAFQDPESGP